MRENIKRDCSRVSTILLINILIMSAILSYTSGWIQITGYVFEVVLVYFAICRRGEIENSKLVTYKFDTNLIFIIIAFIMLAAVFSVLSVQYEKVLNYYGYTAGYTDFHKFQIADIVIYGIVVPVAEEMVYRLFIFDHFIKYGTEFAAFSTSFLFAVLHFNFVQIIYAFISGILLAYVRQYYSVLHGLVIHIVNNMILVYLFLIMNISIKSAVIVFTILFLLVKIKKVKNFICKIDYKIMRIHDFFMSRGIIVITIFSIVIGIMEIKKI